MSEFSDMLAQGFAEAISQSGTPIVCGAVTRSCIVTPFVQTAELRDSGFWSQISTTAELTRNDYTALDIVMHSVVTINGAALKVMLIEDDPADPCIRLQLKPSR